MRLRVFNLELGTPELGTADHLPGVRIMKRYAIAVVLLATIGTLVNAQQPGTGGTPPPGPGMPPPGPGLPAPKVALGTTIIPVTTGSAHGFYKSGGVLVGANG